MIILSTIRRLHGAGKVLHYSTALGIIVWLDNFYWTICRCFGVNFYIDELCTNFNTYTQNCRLRENRNALVKIGAGVISTLNLINALADWMLQVREPELSPARRTSALFALLRACVRVCFRREVIMWFTLSILDPMPNSVLELTWFSFA